MDALKRVLAARIDRENYGMLCTKSVNDGDLRTLNRAHILISGNTITKDGNPVYVIKRRYAMRKTRGNYNELTPLLVPISA
jgi:hypothetical protein